MQTDSSNAGHSLAMHVVRSAPRLHGRLLSLDIHAATNGWLGHPDRQGEMDEDTPQPIQLARSLLSQALRVSDDAETRAPDAGATEARLPGKRGSA